MPYSILNLPPIHQDRLRQLTTPKEAVSLQIAAGNEKTTILKSLQPLKKYSNHYGHRGFFLTKVKETLVLSTQEYKEDVPVDFSDDQLVCVDTQLTLNHLGPADYDDPIFKKIYINCPSIVFNANCHVDAQSLHKFVKKCVSSAVKNLHITNCTSDVTLPLIFECFKNVKSVTITQQDYAYENWIQDVFQSGKTGLVSLNFAGSCENLFSFEPPELKTLFETQEPIFDLTFTCDDPPLHADQTVREILGPYFREFKYDGGHIDGSLRIKLGPEWSKEAIRMWYQIVPKSTRSNEPSWNYDMYCHF